MGFWWRALFSPHFSIRRFRRYGYIFSNYLKSIKATGRIKLGLSGIEAESESLRNLEEVENIIGYCFNNRSLLYDAFTHPSYSKACVSYERLEYIGDSVLNLLITKEQLSMYPTFPPGILTPLRAANVDTEKLARVAVQHNFHRYIRFDNPVVRRQIQAFINVLPNHPLHSHGLINAPKMLADVVEATLGAVFVDSNYSIDTTWEVASYLLKPIITPAMLQKNPVKKLFEICQKHKLKVEVVDLWSEERTFQVLVDDELTGKGVCLGKKDIAFNRAANDAYKKVVRRIGLTKHDEGGTSTVRTGK